VVSVLATHLVAFAFGNPLTPIIFVVGKFLDGIYGVVHNYGWSLILLALVVKAAMWPLNTMQFKSMLSMQELQPKIKALQAKYKNDKEKLNEATMALYKEKGANPAAGCLPMLVQLPVIYSVYFAITSNKGRFVDQTWLWIGSKFSALTPIVTPAVTPPAIDAHAAYHVLALNLAVPDYLLLGLYIVSMYFSVRFTSPPSPDPAVAQQQRIMAFISPAMIGFFGFKYAWPSGLIIYWLSFNVFTMAQQIYLIRKYHRNPTAVGPQEPPPSGGSLKPSPKPLPANGAVAVAANGSTANASSNGGGGSRAARRRRSSRR
jgi:YidC/Oxa1 family membrane protein insertase